MNETPATIVSAAYVVLWSRSWPFSIASPPSTAQPVAAAAIPMTTGCARASVPAVASADVRGRAPREQGDSASCSSPHS